MRNFLKIVIVAVFASLSGCGSYLLLDPISELESQFYVWKLFVPRDPSDKIFIIGIDDHSAKEIQDSEDRRSHYARALRKLAKLNPSVIGVDVILEREDERSGSKLIGILAKTQKNIVFAQEFDFYSRKPNRLFSALRESEIKKGIVSVFSPKSSIGFITLPLGYLGERYWHSSLIATVYCQFRFNGVVGEECLESIIRETNFDLTTPVGIALNDTELPINFVGDYEDFAHMDLKEFLNTPEPPNLSGKIVLLGSVSNYLRDTVDSPIAARFYGQSHGIVVMANALHTLVSGENIKVVRDYSLFLIIIATSAVYLLCLKITRYPTVVLVGSLSAIVILSYTCFRLWFVQIPISPFVVSLILASVTAELTGFQGVKFNVKADSS